MSAARATAATSPATGAATDSATLPAGAPAGRPAASGAAAPGAALLALPHPHPHPQPQPARPARGVARGRLRREARRVLLRNWTGSATVPSPGLYPHQWSWDSAFIAIGLRHLSPLRAQRELETLLTAQWDDGRIPHIVFNPAVPLHAYFPSPDFWRSATAGAACGAPRGPETSGIVQPPVHALAAWLVHKAHPGLSERRGFLTRVYPRLTAWHDYLVTHRDLGGGGLAAVVHPWEPGMDNSPCWDAPLERIEPAPAASFRRADLDHGAAADRPTDLDYGRYVRLAAAYRDRGYRDAGPPHPFAVEDPGVNALLIASERALAAIATAVGADPARHRNRADRLTATLVERLWDPEAGQFLCRDLYDDSLLPERSAAGLLPLLAPGLPHEITGTLLRTASGEHFGLGRTVRLLPSYDLRGRAFDPYRYWRGPAWFNVNWLLERGLRLHGRTGRADALRNATLDAAVASGFAEYIDPFTGEARGTRGFSWTAALALDLLAEAESAAPASAPRAGTAGRGAGAAARNGTGTGAGTGTGTDAPDVGLDTEPAHGLDSDFASEEGQQP